MKKHFNFTVNNLIAGACAASMMVVAVPAWADDVCTADIAAPQFFDVAALHANSMRFESETDAGSCAIVGVSVLANASTAAEKTCKFDVLSVQLRSGWALDGIQFHQGGGDTHLDWAQGSSSFTLKADPGKTAQVTLISFSVCGPSEEWEQAF